MENKNIFIGIIEGDELYVTDDNSILSNSIEITEYLGKYIMVSWNNEDCDIISVGNSIEDTINNSLKESISYFDNMGSNDSIPSIDEIKNIIKNSYVHGDSDNGLAIFKVEMPTEICNDHHYYTIDAGEL